MFTKNPDRDFELDDGVLYIENTRDGKQEAYDIDEISDVAVVEDYSIIDMTDLIVQSFFALCFSLLLGSFTLLVFVGVDLGSPKMVIISLLKRNFFLTAFLFAGGIISPSILFLTYYRRVRSKLVDKYQPSESVVKFTYEGDKYEFSGVANRQAHELAQKISSD